MRNQPSEAQLAALREGDPSEPLALVSFARAADAAALVRWRDAHRAAVQATGGRCVFRGRVDASLAGGVACEEWILDEFPSRELCAESLRTENPHAAALDELVVMSALPRALPGRLVLGFARLAAKVRGGRGGRGGERAGFAGLARNAEASPDAVALLAYLDAKPDEPFFMFNLHQFRDRAQYPGVRPGSDPEHTGDTSGRAAYARYGRNTITQLLRRDAGPVWRGTPLGLVVGPEGHPLAGAWSEILLVRYPTRRAMRDMLEDPAYQRGVHHRDAALARAVLLPMTKLEMP